MNAEAQEIGKDARRLREFSAFDKFSDDELERLLRAAHHMSRSKPWPLIREQTPSDECYVLLDGEVVAASRYAVHGRLDAAPLDDDPREREVRAFAGTVARWRSSLPSGVVVDVGLARDESTGRERWVVVEANMAWFAHCYYADPDRVLDVVLRSAGPLTDIAAADFGYLHARA